MIERASLGYRLLSCHGRCHHHHQLAVATIFSDQSIIGVDELAKVMTVLPVLNHRHGDNAMGEQWTTMVIRLVTIDLNRQLPQPEDTTSSLLVTIHHDDTL